MSGGAAVPLWNALGEGEETSVAFARDGVVVVGGKNPSRAPTVCVIETLARDGQPVDRLELALNPGDAAFEKRFVRVGWRLRLVNQSGGVVVPFAFPLVRAPERRSP